MHSFCEGKPKEPRAWVNLCNQKFFLTINQLPDALLTKLSKPHHWCLLVEITDVEFDGRLIVHARDTEGTEATIEFFRIGRGTSLRQIHRGNALVILSAEIFVSDGHNRVFVNDVDRARVSILGYSGGAYRTLTL